jgi:hypothetical protein
MGGAPGAMLEVCNGLDDDGNAMTDEATACPNMFPDALNVQSWTCSGVTSTCTPTCMGTFINSDGKAWNGCEDTVKLLAPGPTAAVFVMSDVGNDRIFHTQPGVMTTQLSPRQWTRATMSAQASDNAYAIVGSIGQAQTTIIGATGVDMGTNDVSQYFNAFSGGIKDAGGTPLPGANVGTAFWLSQLTPGSSLVGYRTNGGVGQQLWRGSPAWSAVPGGDLTGGVPIADMPAVIEDFGAPTGATLAAWVTATGDLHIAAAVTGPLTDVAGGNPIVTGLDTTVPIVLSADPTSNAPTVSYVDGTGAICTITATMPGAMNDMWSAPACVGHTKTPFAVFTQAGAQAAMIVFADDTAKRVKSSMAGATNTLVTFGTTASRPVVIRGLGESLVAAHVYVVVDGTAKRIRVDAMGAVVDTFDFITPIAREVAAAQYVLP